jgi:hypothetical protein
MLAVMVKKTRKKNGQRLFNNLVAHLQEEVPEANAKGFDNFVRERPYELIQTILILSERKTFKGTCPVCEDWH